MTIKKYFCFELLTAGLVVGWLGMVKSATTTASLITMLIDPDYYISYDSFSSLPPMTVRSSKFFFICNNFQNFDGSIKNRHNTFFD